MKGEKHKWGGLSNSESTLHSCWPCKFTEDVQISKGSEFQAHRGLIGETTLEQRSKWELFVEDMTAPGFFMVYMIGALIWLGVDQLRKRL